MHIYDIYARSYIYARNDIYADAANFYTDVDIVSANNNFQFGQNGKEDITVADLMRHEVRLIQNCTVSKNMMITRKGQKKT